MPTFREDTKIGGMVPMMKTDDINDQAITKDKIRDGNVTAEKLADGAVSTDKLPDGAIKTPKIADGNITTSKLAEASVVTSKIADQNVTKEKIADQSVDNSKLSPEAVTYDKLKDKSVITEKLNDRAVTTEKVEEKAITNAKLGDQSVDGRVIREASIESKHIGNNAVSTPKIASRSVTNEKIAHDSVSRAELTPDVRNSIDKKADAEQVNNSLYNLEKKIGDRFVIEGDVTNLPDEEDLTSVKESEHDVLKLADRSYAPYNFSGKGYKILRRNIKPVSIAVTKIIVESVPLSDGTLSFTINGKETQVAVSAATDNTTALVAQKVASALQESMTEYDVSIDASLITLTRKSNGSVTPSVFSASTTGVVCTVTDSTKRELRNILTPVMINQPNTIYEIRYDFDLNQNIINIPSNCVLCFKGGSFVNGSLYGTDTELINFHNVLNVELLGSFTNNGFHVSNYFKLVEKYNCILSASLLYISKYDSFLDDCMKFQNMLGIDYYHICLNIDVDSSSNPTKIIYATKCEYDKVTTLEEIINILNVSIPLCKHGIFEGFKIHTENSRIDKLLTNVTNGKSQILEFFDLYMNDLEKFRNLNCRNEVTFFAFMNEENQLFNIEDKDIIDKLKQVIQKIKSIFPKAQVTYSASHYIEYSSIIQYMNYPSINLYLHDLSYKGIDTKVTDVINNYSTIKRQIEHTLSNLVNFRLTEFGALNNEHGLTDGASFENRGKQLEPFYVPYLHCLALFTNINISRFIGFSIWFFDSYYIKNNILYTYWGDETVSNGYLTDIISIFKFTFYENI